MIAELQCVVLDCPDPVRLAEFYRSVLGGRLNEPDRRWALGENWTTLHTDAGLVLAFQRVADHRPPQWPDPARPQQFHLDFGVPDLDAAQAEVVAAGATVLDDGSEGGSEGGEADAERAERPWRIYADPAGHPFCLVLHRVA
ncbi:VOC family protein [Streptomyces sp. NPDC048496]|uniref:VOC family protein n=1 Tax=Streptomyces sp. NPDC048496 TaxID=3365558 RepID=UPI00371CF952